MMAKVDVGSLTLDESKELFVELLGVLPDYTIRDLIVENSDAAMLEEMELACQEKMQELADEEENEEDES